jgi:hypothetical protein
MMSLVSASLKVWSVTCCLTQFGRIQTNQSTRSALPSLLPQCQQGSCSFPVQTSNYFVLISVIDSSALASQQILIHEDSSTAVKMPLIFAARRGRRVFQRFNNLQQTAPLSTRVPIAVSYSRRVFRLPENRAASLIKGGNYTLERFTTVQKHHYSEAATDKPRKSPTKSGKSTKSTGTKKKVKAKKPKKALKPKKAKKELTPEQLEKKKNAKHTSDIKDLTAQSLRKEEPKTHSSSPWVLFVGDKVRGASTVEETRRRFRDAGEEFKNLSAYEREVRDRISLPLMIFNKPSGRLTHYDLYRHSSVGQRKSIRKRGANIPNG